MFSAIAKISGVNQDITRQVKKYGQDSINLNLEIGDSIYLGARLKFNHAFIKQSVLNIVPARFKVSLYDGKVFNDVGRLSDATEGFLKSDIIEFSPSQKTSWASSDTSKISDIEDIQFLDMFWIKITFEDAIVLDLDYVGHKFSNDYDLFSEYPSLNKSKFLAFFNQDDFEKQSIIAGELIESELIKQGQAVSNLQVLEWSDLTLASVVKTAQLIYTSFGNTYTDNVVELKKEFVSRIGNAYPLIDKKGTAEKSGNVKTLMGTLHR